MIILINPTDNQSKNLLPVQGFVLPLVLTGAWQDLPENHLINCQDIGSIGVWLEMSGVSDVDIRLQAAYNSNTSAFFDLPTIEINSGNFLLKPQQFKIPGPGLVNLVHSFPLADVVNYVKIQVKGTGTINKATLTHKFRPTR